MFVNCYYLFLRRFVTRFWGVLLRVFEVNCYVVLRRLGAWFWGGFGAVWCAVLTFFMFFVSGSHDFAFVLDPEFIFSVQTIQTSYSFCPKSPYYPLKPNSSQNFMVRDEISFFEPNPSVNSYGLNRSFFSLDQKPHILSQSPHTSALAHLIAKPPQALSHHQKTAPESNVSGAGSILYFTIYLAFAASKKA